MCEFVVWCSVDMSNILLLLVSGTVCCGSTPRFISFTSVLLCWQRPADGCKSIIDVTSTDTTTARASPTGTRESHQGVWWDHRCPTTIITLTPHKLTHAYTHTRTHTLLSTVSHPRECTRKFLSQTLNAITFTLCMSQVYLWIAVGDI